MGLPLNASIGAPTLCQAFCPSPSSAAAQLSILNRQSVPAPATRNVSCTEIQSVTHVQFFVPQGDRKKVTGKNNHQQHRHMGIILRLLFPSPVQVQYRALAKNAWHTKDHLYKS